jgi:hypothetical protein
MMPEPTRRPIGEIEAELATLRAELDALPSLLAEAEAAVGAAEAPLEEARAVHAAAGAAWAATLQPPDPLATWREPRAATDMAERQRDAEAAWKDADVQVQQALITRNTLDARRGALRGRQRFLQAQVEQAEGELVRAQQVAPPSRDRLASIRERLGLGS